MEVANVSIRNLLACLEKDWFPAYLAVSFNQPKLCPNATWNPNATTFATNSTVGSTPRGIFITTNNTVVVPNRSNGRTIVWFNGSSNPTSNISTNLSDPSSVFVTGDSEIFVNNNSPYNRIDKWTFNMTLVASPMDKCDRCAVLFIDINNDLYCSQDNQHQVLKRSLNDPTKATSIIAGTGCSGSAPYMLSSPNGIFVTEKGPNGFRCLVGCSQSASASSDHLSCPEFLSFDAGGNMFVTNSGNNRIQKFLLLNNTCGKLTEFRRQRECVWGTWDGYFCCAVSDSTTKIRCPCRSVD